MIYGTVGWLATHLHGELAGGHEHEHPGGGHAAGAVQEALEHGQHEGGGLAGARLGATAHVAARHGQRDHCRLDGRGGGVPERRARLEQRAGEVQLPEGLGGEGHLHAVLLQHDVLQGACGGGLWELPVVLLVRGVVVTLVHLLLLPPRLLPAPPHLAIGLLLLRLLLGLLLGLLVSIFVVLLGLLIILFVFVFDVLTLPLLLLLLLLLLVVVVAGLVGGAAFGVLVVILALAYVHLCTTPRVCFLGFCPSYVRTLPRSPSTLLTQSSRTFFFSGCGFAAVCLPLCLPFNCTHTCTPPTAHPTVVLPPFSHTPQA
eukprot:8175593-Pyramimonas_sp.AAC.1